MCLKRQKAMSAKAIRLCANNLRLKGRITLPGDKSIAHRVLIISALSNDVTVIKNFPTNKDCLWTLNALKKLGIKIKAVKSKNNKHSAILTVKGAGLLGLKKPKAPIFVGDSATTLRLLLGVLAGQDFKTKLICGSSLSHRPMLRVTYPLRMMGAEIKARVKRGDCLTSIASARAEEYPPITIRGGRLKPVIYKMPIASAQVKSAIILAGLYTEGSTRVYESIKTRDHTERMLHLFKADIKTHPFRNTKGLKNKKKISFSGNAIVIKGGKELTSPKKIYVPGDISSASFFIVLAAILPNSQILLKDVSLNPSRLGIIKVLRRMGQDIKIRSKAREVKSSEPIGDILAKSSALKGMRVRKEEIPSLIDELPILMVAACYASGRTIIEGVKELRVKETDRIRSMTENLKKMGADIRVIKKGSSENLIVRGVKHLKAARVKTFSDHRTAMSMVIAGLIARGQTKIDDISCINKSFPDFIELLWSLNRPFFKRSLNCQ